MKLGRWYVTQTSPRAELIAQRNLDHQGFANFCPRFRRTRRHARQVEQVFVPLFPRYIFVQFDRERDQWRSINGTLGVKHLVGPSAIRPQPMPDAAMDALFARCRDGIIQSLMESFEPGQPVQVVTGPFVDRMATIEHLDEQGRVHILLNILGRPTALRVNRCDLAPA